MRESTIPPMRRLSRITEAGRLAVDVSATGCRKFMIMKNWAALNFSLP